MTLRRYVIHIITTFSPGGAENQLVEILKVGLQGGKEFQVWYLKGKGELAQEFMHVSNIQIKKLSLKVLFLFSREKFSDFGKNYLTKKTFIFHCHLPRSEIIGTVLSLLFRVPLVVTKHNCETMWPSAPKAISRALARIVEWRALASIYISNSVYQYLSVHKELGRNLDRHHVIHYGIRGEPTMLPKNSPLGRSGFFRIGMLARLEKQKNIETFLLALDILKKRGLRFEAFIYGEGSLELELKCLSESLGLEKQVFFKGKQSDREAIYRGLHCVVLTSLYEGFGMIFLEAMKYATPVLASRTVTALEVLCEHQEFFFDIGDSLGLSEKIAELMINPKEVNKNIELLSSLLGRYNIYMKERELYKVYEKVCM